MAHDDVLDVLLHEPGIGPRKLSARQNMTLSDLLGDAGVDKDFLVFPADDELEQDDDKPEAAPLPREASIGALAKGRVVTIHCHRCRQIQVTVNYQSRSIERKFPPSARVRRVLRWSKRKLELKDADADNLALFPCAGGEKVRENLHVGELTTGKQCDVCFNLSKDVNIEGAT